MSGLTITAAVAPALLAGFVMAAAPKNALKSTAVSEPESEITNLEIVAQAEQPGLEAQEQQLLRQIQMDTAKLRADETAESAPAARQPADTFYSRIASSPGEAASQLQHTSKHYEGHRAEALRAMVAAHDSSCNVIELIQEQVLATSLSNS